MDELEMERRLTEATERAKSNTHRLDKLEPIVNEIHNMSQRMVELVQEVKHTNDTVHSLSQKFDRMDSRVDEMEREPAVEAKKYKTTAITAIISTIAGSVATGVIAFIAHFI